MSLRSVAIVCLGLALALAVPSWAQEQPGNEPANQADNETCPHQKGWKPTTEELERILSDHEQWLEKNKNAATISNEGKANLCNADLRKADLNLAVLDGADLSDADLTDASMIKTKLNNALLYGAKLANANLTWTELNRANLSLAKLNGADLVFTQLNDANLKAAELDGASLPRTELSNADLSRASLKKAALLEAKLTNANLLETSLDGASLAYVDLTGAIYAPYSASPPSVVVGIKGLSTVSFPPGNETGLVQLRDVLQKAGLRDLEREATFAIESGNTRHLIEDWKNNLARAAEGVFRYVAFQLTTAYGLQPARALLLIVVLWAALIPIYAWPIRRSKRPATSSSIYRIWPNGRIEVREDRPTVDNPVRVERLHGRGLRALAWAAYFSLLSAFQIGFREFSFGTWLSRAQPRNFALEATGWIRTVSGLQSLLSVYLLAMWILTYFGRPFQ